MLHDLDRGHREDLLMSGDHAKDVLDPVPHILHIEVVGVTDAFPWEIVFDSSFMPFPILLSSAV